MTKIKRTLEMDDEAWKLLKAYAALVDLPIGKANEKLVKDNLHQLKDVVKDV